MAPKAKVKAKAKAAVKAKAKATPKAKPGPKAKAAAKAAAKGLTKDKVEAPKKAKATTAPSEEPPAKKVKAAAATTEPATAPAASSSSASSSAADPLALAPLFGGGGRGGEWEPILHNLISGLPKAAEFIGPSRNKGIVPVRELTFQALKPNGPGGWCVVSLGQSPYPRLESATGIAHFDSTIKDWEDKRFSVVSSMRCIIKAAAIHKFKADLKTPVGDLRKILKANKCVGPNEWFQAMLAQGVLLMNAALTLLPSEDKTVRAGTVVQEHTKFWQPVVEKIVDAILTARGKEGKGVVFAWWGGESKKVKAALGAVFKKHKDVKVEHVEHKNPAAMYDSFCDEPNVFAGINAALKRIGQDEIDWLPSEGWKAKLKNNNAGNIDEYGDFISETQELHKMYLERLRDGLTDRKDELPDITGVHDQPLVELPESFLQDSLKAASKKSVEKAGSMTLGPLDLHEAAALHLYTTNYLYRQLNEALRSENRKKVEEYLKYLRLFFSAAEKLPKSTKMLYRGVSLDLASQYPQGGVVTWWSVSSCTPELKVAQSFASGSKVSTLFRITPKRSIGIRHLSQYAHEEEFIFVPGTQFKVVKVEKKGTKSEIFLEEIDGEPRVR